MSSKTLIYGTGFLGSVIGGYLPLLWGGSAFSISSLVLSAVGGIMGVLLGLKIMNNI